MTPERKSNAATGSSRRRRLMVVASPKGRIGNGRLPERTNGAASKAVVASGSPWVRIPHLPPIFTGLKVPFHDGVGLQNVL